MELNLEFKSVVRMWLLGLAVIFYCLVWAACQSSPKEQFSKVKMNMTKDDVLEIVGSPQRTERIDGKDKWAYHIFRENLPSDEAYMQVTFREGHVVSAGVDFDEIKRLSEIAAEDEKNAQARKASKEKLATAAKNTKASDDSSVEGEVKQPTEEDFVEIKGRNGPIEKPDSDD